MQHLETVTVGSGGAASITFSAIPATFTDLVVVYSARGTFGQGSFLYRLNGASSGYSNRNLTGDGSITSSGTSTTLTSTNAGGTWGRLFANGQDSNTTANTFSNVQLYIPNYLSTTNKSISGDLVSENNATQAFQSIAVGLFTTSSPVTELGFALFEGSFTQHTSISLYGILAGSDGITAVS